MPWSRLRVPWMRLSRIRTFAWSVSRWLIVSPIRLTTPSMPSRAAGGGRSVVARQACQVTVGFVGRAFSGLRVRPTTSSPRASRASQRSDPIRPEAPVTRTRMSAVSGVGRGTVAADDLEGAGLLGEASEAGGLRLVHHRTGDAGGDVAVEDRRDDVVLGQVIVGDDLRDAAGGRQLHLFGDPGGAGVEGAAEDPGEAEDVVDLVRIVRTAGGHDPDVLLGLLRHHLGSGIGHREDDRVVVHLPEGLRLDQAGTG